MGKKPPPPVLNAPAQNPRIFWDTQIPKSSVSDFSRFLTWFLAKNLRISRGDLL